MTSFFFLKSWHPSRQSDRWPPYHHPATKTELHWRVQSCHRNHQPAVMLLGKSILGNGWRGTTTCNKQIILGYQLRKPGAGTKLQIYVIFTETIKTHKISICQIEPMIRTVQLGRGVCTHGLVYLNTGGDYRIYSLTATATHASSGGLPVWEQQIWLKATQLSSCRYIADPMHSMHGCISLI